MIFGPFAAGPPRPPTAGPTRARDDRTDGDFRGRRVTVTWCVGGTKAGGAAQSTKGHVTVTNPHDVPDERERAAWLTALDAALAGPAMRRSPRSRQLLRYIVEETLAGRRDAITGTTIAQDVLGRDADFDGGGDAIVRVQMRRLRLLLSEDPAETVGGDGGSVPHIEVPKGAYRPRLVRPAPAAPPAPAPPPGEVAEPDPRPETTPVPAGPAALGPVASLRAARRAFYAVVGLAVIATAALWIDDLAALLSRDEVAVVEVEEPGPQIRRTVPVRDDYPTVAVLPFRNQTGDPENDVFSAGFQYQVSADLQRFGTIRVFAADVPPAHVGDVAVEYVIGGSVIDVDDEVDVFIFLQDAQTGHSVFERRVVEPSGGIEDRNDYFHILSEFSSVLSGFIAGPHGDIERHETARVIAADGLGVDGGVEPLRCVSMVQGFLDTRAVEDYRHAQTCLTDSLRERPDDGVLTAYQGMLALYSVPEMGLMDTRSLPWTYTMDEARALAERAASLDPGSDVAHAVRGVVLNAADRNAEAVASLRRASDLNPGNPTIHGLLALALMGQDRWDDALLAAQSAIAHSAEPQSFYYLPQFMRALVMDDAEGAVRAGRRIAQTPAEWARVPALIAADLAGDEEDFARLRPLVEDLAAEHDGDPLQGLRHWMPSETGMALLEERLRAIGVAVSPPI